MPHAARSLALAPDHSPAAAERWAALTHAGAAIAGLAGEAPCPLKDWDTLAADAAPWRLARAECDLEDLTAILRAGLAALIAVQHRGADVRPAAAALLREFTDARAALLRLLAPIR